MKCWVLWIERSHAKIYKRASYSGNAGIIKAGLFKGTLGFTIPDRAKPIELEFRLKTVPLWQVDGRTGIALTLEEAEIEEEKPLVITNPVSKKQKTVQIPIYKKKVGSIAIYPVSDPTTYIKLNVLSKGTFYEAIMKRLKIGLIATIIYMCAGGGLFLLGLYLIKIIFLKESTI